jgi:hypothetical protein
MILFQSIRISFTQKFPSSTATSLHSLKINVVFYSILVLLIGVCCYCHAQQNPTVIGARANAMGYAAACQQDIWSVFGNPAGLAEMKEAQASFAYDAMPSFATFNRMASGTVFPSKYGVIGGGVYRFGDELYNEQILSAAFANKLGIASLGIKGNLIQYNVEGFGQKRLFTVSVGGLVQFTPWLCVGAFVSNVNQPEIQSERRIPTHLYLGVGARPSSNCFITTEVEKDLDYGPVVKAGLEYVVYKKISLRTGVNLLPVAGFCGVGFKPTWFQLDYAFSAFEAIGSRHQASVVYQLRKKTK